MATAHVQGAVASNGATVTTLNVVLGSLPVAGNLVCVGVAFSSAVTNLVIKDENGNQYTVTPNSPSTFQSGAGQVWLAYRRATSNAGKTLTLTWTTSSVLAVWADEFSYSGNAKFDSDAKANSAAASTTISTPTITPSLAGSLLYACAASGGTISAPAAGAVLGAWTGAGGAITLGDMAEYILSQAASNRAVQFTQSSAVWSAMVMAFLIDRPGHIQLESGTGNVELEDLSGDIALET